MAGTLFIVSTPIGNLEDITTRALRVLRTVAVIAAEDTRHTAGLLSHFGIATPTVSLHEHNEAARIPRLLERLAAGEDVAVVSDAGTPTVSDPGQRLVRAAIDAGLRVEPVPGPSAVLAAIAASGFAGNGFTFLGFPPTKTAERAVWIDRLKSSTGIVVFFEAPHRILDTLGDVLRTVGPETDIVVCRELTKMHEELVRGPIEKILDAPPPAKGEFTIVINLGEQSKTSLAALPVDVDLVAELAQITKSTGLSRRKAMNVLARRTGLTPNEVYAAVERAKKSVK